MKIAIIGSGVSGLTSAYLLAPQHEVTVFEKENRLGGHTHTHELEIKGQRIIADTGFMVFNPDRYPLFIQLLKDLGVSSRATTMSFSVHIPGEVSYRGNFPNGLFADRKSLFNLRYLRFVREIIRFRSAAKLELEKNPASEESLESLLGRLGFSRDFAQWFLYPMLAAIWSIEDTSDVHDFPALSTLRFLDNHKLLDQRHPTWQTIGGGAAQYVEAIKKSVGKNSGRFVLEAGITEVSRSEEKVQIKTANDTHRFDAVVMATHANTALTLLKDASKDESRALSRFSYTKNKTFLHSDQSVVSRNPRVMAAWNYVKESKDASGASFTYNLNKLQHVPDEHPLFVTLNPARDIDSSSVYAEMSYEHPLYSTQSIIGQKEIQKLQGSNNTFYAGAHLGFGFHEDGVASAASVAQKLKVKIPWQISE